MRINWKELNYFLSFGRMWGIERILYDITWNQYQIKDNKYKTNYHRAITFSMIQKDEIFLKFLYDRKSKYEN